MATGAAHYQRAEQLEALAIRQWEQGQGELATHITMPQAQLHATLALAAAVIEPTVQTFARGEGTDERIITEWSEAVSG